MPAVLPAIPAVAVVSRDPSLLDRVGDAIVVEVDARASTDDVATSAHVLLLDTGGASAERLERLRELRGSDLWRGSFAVVLADDEIALSEHRRVLDADDAELRTLERQALGRRIAVWQELAEARYGAELLQSALDSSVNGICVADARVRGFPISYVSKTFERMTGYSRDECVGRSCRFLQHEGTDPHAIDAIRSALETGARATVVVSNRRKDGGIFWNELTLVPFRDASGRVMRVIGVQHDVTAFVEAQRLHRESEERSRSLAALVDSGFAVEASDRIATLRVSGTPERIELDRKEAQRLVALGSMTAGLTHEIRNPLATMSLLLGELVQVPDAPAKQLAKKVQRQLERVIRLVRDTALIARPHPPQRLMVDARSIVNAAADALASRLAETKLELCLELGTAQGLVFVDEKELVQILVALVNNALDAARAKVVVRMTATAEAIILHVIDDGPGIPPPRGRANLRAVLHDEVDGDGTRTLHREATCGGTRSRARPGRDVRPGNDIHVGAEERMMTRILLVEDDVDLAEAIAFALGRNAWSISIAISGARAIEESTSGPWTAIVVDLGLPDIDGIELIARLRSSDARVPIIVLSGRDEAAAAVAALRSGADDYLTKPFDRTDLESRIQLLVRQQEVIRELDAVGSGADAPPPLGRSEAFLRALDRARAAARSPTTSVLLFGESGVGKEVLARWIHRLSPRASGPFVAMNSACLSPNLIESELFGHEAGAFTGATARHRGLFEIAQGGTLFLDEIGELPLTLQPKLLRVLEERCFRRVGGTQEIRVDLRLLTATNRDLAWAVGAGQFRSDLYHRLRVFEVDIPPLRERGDDVLLLAAAFAKQLGATLGREAQWHSDAHERLRAHDWSGNVRELRNATEHALLVSTTSVLRGRDLPPDVGVKFSPMPNRRTELATLDSVIERHVREVFAATGNNVSRAAAILGIGRVALRRRLTGTRDGDDPPPSER